MSGVRSLQFNIWREDGTPGKVFIAEDEVVERLAELHSQGWTRIQWKLDAERGPEREYDQEWNIDGFKTVDAVAECIRERAPHGRKARKPNKWARARAAEEPDEVVAGSGPSCSFCSKPRSQVDTLITSAWPSSGASGPHVAICNECVQLCVDIIGEDPKKAG